MRDVMFFVLFFIRSLSLRKYRQAQQRSTCSCISICCTRHERKKRISTNGLCPPKHVPPAQAEASLMHMHMDMQLVWCQPALSAPPPVAQSAIIIAWSREGLPWYVVKRLRLCPLITACPQVTDVDRGHLQPLRGEGEWGRGVVLLIALCVCCFSRAY